MAEAVAKSVGYVGNFT